MYASHTLANNLKHSAQLDKAAAVLKAKCVDSTVHATPCQHL